MGIVGEMVTDVSQRLLAEHGGLRGLFRMELAELARLRRLGDVKAVRLKAALELGRRLAALSPEERSQTCSATGQRGLKRAGSVGGRAGGGR